MTFDIALVLIILGGALVLFVTEKVRMTSPRSSCWARWS